MKYFDISAIISSLFHFVIGKGFTIFSSVSIVILLARYLSIQEYAIYISWQAIILIIGLVTSAGIQGVLNRYLPELRSCNNNKLVYRMIVIGVFSRLIFITLTVFCVNIFLPQIILFLNQPGWEWLLHWYLYVGLIKLVSLSLVQVMESLLWQRISQYSLAAASVAKLFGILTFMSIGKLTLESVVIIEMLSEILLFFLLLYGLYKSWQRDSARDRNDKHWWELNKLRVFKYGSSKYLIYLSMLFYGSGPNRLLASNLMPSSDVALLGFTDSLMTMLYRFMPSNLFLGLIRPLFIADFSTSGDFDKLARMSNTLFRINMLILIPAAVMVIVVGETVFDWITDGKYGDANLLLAGFIFLLILGGLRSILELSIESMEKNKISILTGLIQSLSTFLAIPLLSFIGLWGLVVANMVGITASLIICIFRLGKNNFHFSIDKMLCSLIVIYGILAGSLGWYVISISNSVIFSGVVIFVSYTMLCVIKPPFYKAELDMFSVIINSIYDVDKLTPKLFRK